MYIQKVNTESTRRTFQWQTSQGITSGFDSQNNSGDVLITQATICIASS